MTPLEGDPFARFEEHMDEGTAIEPQGHTALLGKGSKEKQHIY